MSATMVREHEPSAEGALKSGGISVLTLDDVDESLTQRDVARFVNENGLKKLSGIESTFKIGFLFAAWIGLFIVGRWIDHVAAWIVVWIAMAIVFEGFGGALHEAAHDKLYAKRIHNRIAGWIVALPRLYNFPANQASHLHHHRFTGDPERDSEPVYEKSGLADYLLYMSGSHIVYTFIIFYQGALAMTPWRSPWFITRSQRRRAMAGTVVVVASIALIVLGFRWDKLFMYQIWFIPWLLCNSIVTSWVTQPEHFETDPVPPGSILTTTRSVRSNPYFGFFLWNNNFHAAHHLVPSLPGRGLPVLNDYIEPYVKYKERSYTRWHVKTLMRLLKRPTAASVGRPSFWARYGARTSSGAASQDTK